MTTLEFFDYAYVLMVNEAGGIGVLESRLDEIWKDTPMGQKEMRENWGRTPEAIAAAQAAEAMFRPTTGTGQ